MGSTDKYQDLKLEIARAAAAEQHPSLKRFRRLFSEEFGYAPPGDLEDYFKALLSEPGAVPEVADEACDMEIEWTLEKPGEKAEPRDDTGAAAVGEVDPAAAEGGSRAGSGGPATFPLSSLVEGAELQALEQQTVLEQMARLMRTPLTSILGFCNLLQEVDLDAPAAEHVSKIEQSVDRLICGTTDLIDAYRIQAGDLQMVPLQFDLRMIAGQVMAAAEPGLGSKPVALNLRIDEQVPALLWGDGRRVRQVLAALLNNAVKHTEVGAIDLVIEAAKLDSQGIELRITIRDTGPGIPPEMRETLFEIPRGATAPPLLPDAGHSLKLFVCRHIARRMQGDLTVASEAAEGTEFELTLHLARADMRRLEQGSRVLAGMQVYLCAEDAAHGSELQQMLNAAGMDARCFETSKEMFSALFASFERGRGPRLCIWWIEAPSPNALKCAKNFGLARVLYPELRLVGIAPREIWQGHGELNALFDSLLTTPLDPDQLCGMLSQAAASAPDASPAAFAPPARRRILVAEDEPFHYELLQEIFSRASHEVIRARSGRELVALFLAEPERFDIIFTDLEMPELDGRQAVRQIRGAGYTQIPIVAISSQLEERERNRCSRAGIDQFIAKPFRRRELLTVLDALIAKPLSGDAADEL